MKYSNPRKFATFTDWPYGSRLRTTCTFEIETTSQGSGVWSGVSRERAVRTTINPKTERAGAAKKLTYSVRQLIVDGDDGRGFDSSVRTYIICKSMYGGISVFQSNMQYQQEYIAESDPRYPEVNALFDQEVTK